MPAVTGTYGTDPSKRGVGPGVGGEGDNAFLEGGVGRGGGGNSQCWTSVGVTTPSS